jgi:hypothetical protein
VAFDAIWGALVTVAVQNVVHASVPDGASLPVPVVSAVVGKIREWKIKKREAGGSNGEIPTCLEPYHRTCRGPRGCRLHTNPR